MSNAQPEVEMTKIKVFVGRFVLNKHLNFGSTTYPLSCYQNYNRRYLLVSSPFRYNSNNTLV